MRRRSIERTFVGVLGMLMLAASLSASSTLGSSRDHASSAAVNCNQ
jgi:hypothetical protein